MSYHTVALSYVTTVFAITSFSLAIFLLNLLSKVAQDYVPQCELS